MQPYQEATQEIKRQGEAPKRLATAGLSLGAGGLALGRVLPFLSQHIPRDLAAKGLSKIDPRFGDFITKATNEGYTIDDAMNLIKEKTAPDQKSIIEQYSPELHQFLTGEIQKGRQPLEAGALAETSGKFKKAIAQMVKDHKAPFSSILESVFGSAQQPQQQGQQQQTSQQGQQQQQGPANGDEALMAALQKILQM